MLNLQLDVYKNDIDSIYSNYYSELLQLQKAAEIHAHHLNLDTCNPKITFTNLISEL